LQNTLVTIAFDQVYGDCESPVPRLPMRVKRREMVGQNSPAERAFSPFRRMPNCELGPARAGAQGVKMMSRLEPLRFLEPGQGSGSEQTTGDVGHFPWLPTQPANDWCRFYRGECVWCAW